MCEEAHKVGCTTCGGTATLVTLSEKSSKKGWKGKESRSYSSWVLAWHSGSWIVAGIQVASGSTVESVHDRQPCISQGTKTSGSYLFITYMIL